MAETADLINEFKSAKPPEKAVIIGGILALIGIAWYLHSKSSGGSSSAPVSTASSGQPQLGFPTVPQGQTPVLPYGYNPVFDPSGNLVGYQGPPPSSGSPPSPSGGPPPSGPPTTGPIPGQKWMPLIPFGQLPVGTRYSTAQDLQAQPYLTWKGTQYLKRPGAGGRLWGTPVNGGSQVLLYEPQSSYPSVNSATIGTYGLSPRPISQKVSAPTSGGTTLMRTYSR